MSAPGEETPAAFEMLGQDAALCGPDGCALPTSGDDAAAERDGRRDEEAQTDLADRPALP